MVSSDSKRIANRYAIRITNVLGIHVQQRSSIARTAQVAIRLVTASNKRKCRGMTPRDGMRLWMRKRTPIDMGIYQGLGSTNSLRIRRRGLVEISTRSVSDVRTGAATWVVKTYG